MSLQHSAITLIEQIYQQQAQRLAEGKPPGATLKMNSIVGFEHDEEQLKKFDLLQEQKELSKVVAIGGPFLPTDKVEHYQIARQLIEDYLVE